MDGLPEGKLRTQDKIARERGPLGDFLVQKVKSKRKTVHLQTVH